MIIYSYRNENTACRVLFSHDSLFVQVHRFFSQRKY